MSDNVYWVLELTLQACRLEDFRILMREMAAAASQVHWRPTDRFIWRR